METSYHRDHPEVTRPHLKEVHGYPPERDTRIATPPRGHSPAPPGVGTSQTPPRTQMNGNYNTVTGQRQTPPTTQKNQSEGRDYKSPPMNGEWTKAGNQEYSRQHMIGQVQPTVVQKNQSEETQYQFQPIEGPGGEYQPHHMEMRRDPNNTSPIGILSITCIMV